MHRFSPSDRRSNRPVRNNVLIKSKSTVAPELTSLSVSQLFDLRAPVLLWDIKTSQLSHNADFSDSYQELTSVSELMPLLTSVSAEKLLQFIGDGVQGGHSFCLDVVFVEPATSCIVWGVALSDEQVVLVFNRHHPIELNSAAYQNLVTLFNSVNAYIWHLNQRGEILFANQAAESVITLEASKNKSLLEVLPLWGDAQRRQDEILTTLKNGIALHGTLEAGQDGDKECWYKVDKIPTRDSSGDVSGLMLLMVDVSVDELNKRALKATEERYREFIHDSSDAVFRIDLYPPVDTTLDATQQAKDIQLSAVLVESNLAMSQMNGSDEISDILGGAFIKNFFSEFDGSLLEFVESSYRLQNKEVSRLFNGEDAFYQLTLSGAIENGLLIRIWGTARDVTESHHYLSALKYQASHDLLTGLPNRAALYAAIETQIKSASEHNRFALILIDLDRFKEINDTLGHDVGDKLLTLIGPRLVNDIDDYQAFIARLGGDEFAVLFPKIRNNQQAVVLGYRILDAIREPFELDGFTAEVNASVGIAIYPDQANDLTTLMRYADVAMYQAKADNAGVSVYRSSYDQYTPQRLSMMNDLGKAIREDQLELYYQPKIDISSGQVYGFEALLRWNHPEVGFIPPVEFISLAEVSNIIHPLTKWVVESSIIQAKAWLDAGYEFSVAANLSTQNLSDEHFVENLGALLEKHQLPAEYLELEITESSIMAYPDRALRTLNEINQLGVALSIDDFGTGYSSLAYLKRLPVSTLKIDSSFVMDILDDAQDSIIVSSTINLAHNLGLEVIAEGVEEREILTMLQDMNCDKAQGYYMAKPMQAKDVQAWLNNEKWYSAE